MEPLKTDIFISYRRSDGRDIARTVQLALKSAKAGNVFFDYSSLRDGVFNEKIYRAIDQCRVFVLVLSPDSMTRCSLPGDWVAIEINRARQAGCTIIPLAIDTNYTAWPAALPESLHFLKSIQQTKLLTDEYFDDSISRLLARIAAAPEKRAGTTPAHKPASPWEGDTLMQALELDNRAVRLVKSDSEASIALWEEAAGMGLNIACAKLGSIYADGRLGRDKDPDKALEWYNSAPTACSAIWFGLARLYSEDDECSANARELAREYHDEETITISVSGRDIAIDASPKFRWILVDKEYTIVMRCVGNTATLPPLPAGRYFVIGFDGNAFRQNRFTI